MWGWGRKPWVLPGQQSHGKNNFPPNSQLFAVAPAVPQSYYQTSSEDPACPSNGTGDPGRPQGAFCLSGIHGSGFPGHTSNKARPGYSRSRGQVTRARAVKRQMCDQCWVTLRASWKQKRKACSPELDRKPWPHLSGS